MRWVVQWLCRLVVRTFFRRIETIGLISVPSAGPTILAINHPNGLVDPLVVMARVPRRVSFLAKEPLFHTPIVKHFVKALECLPVYRREDDADPAHNVATIEAASDLLARGGAIALFPEGLSHDEPALQPLKTGVSRIALAAQARIAGSYPEIVPVKLVPVGLYYSARGVFRSEAAIVFGEPIEVATVELDEGGQPPRLDVHSLTDKLDAALRALTINARDNQLIALAAAAARVLEETSDAGGEVAGAPMHRRLRLMQRILEQHAAFERTNPDQTAAIVERLRRYDALAAARGLSPEVPTELGLGQAITHLLKTVLTLLLLSPLVVVGIVENFLPYRICGRLALRLARDQRDVLSTLKVLAGLIFFPATWLAVSLILGAVFEGSWAIAHAVLAPFAAWAALWFLERIRITLLGARALWLAVFRPVAHRQLMDERRAIADLILGVEGTRSFAEHRTILPPGP